jgi:hypothetical protein
MTTLNEGKHTAEFLLSEGNGWISREEIVISSAAAAMEPGTVLGRIRGTASAAALGTNTGNGTMGAITLGAGAKEGVYKLVIVEPASNAGAFVLEDPSGAVVGHGNVASAFAGGGLSFTLADGATDFVAGDSFAITVAEGTEYAAYDADNTDGTEEAVAVLYRGVPNSASDQAAVAIVRNAEVIEAQLTGIDAAGKKQLAKVGIICR